MVITLVKRAISADHHERPALFHEGGDVAQKLPGELLKIRSIVEVLEDDEVEARKVFGEELLGGELEERELVLVVARPGV